MRQIRKILVVDNEASASKTSEIIQKAGAAGSIEIAVAAKEAIRYIEQREFVFPEQLPDLVLLEINLPPNEGSKFLENYSSLNEDLRDKIHLVILTDDETTKDAVKAASNSDVEEIVSKPITGEKLAELQEKIAEWLKK